MQSRVQAGQLEKYFNDLKLDPAKYFTVPITLPDFWLSLRGFRFSCTDELGDKMTYYEMFSYKFYIRQVIVEQSLVNGYQGRDLVLGDKPQIKEAPMPRPVLVKSNPNTSCANRIEDAIYRARQERRDNYGTDKPSI